MKRGDVRWYEFQPPDKRRPVVILTRDQAIRFLNEVTIAPITSTIRGIPTEVVLTVEDGMPTDCAINCDHLQTVPKQKIGGFIAALSTAKLNRLGPAICFALGLDEYLIL
jgi:mRNA interferase MazF